MTSNKEIIITEELIAQESNMDTLLAQYADIDKSIKLLTEQKKVLRKEFDKRIDGKYESDRFKAELKVVTTNRADSKKIKEFIGEEKYNEFVNPTESTRFTIKEKQNIKSWKDAIQK